MNEMIYGIGMIGLLIFYIVIINLLGKELRAYNQAWIDYLKQKEKGT